MYAQVNAPYPNRVVLVCTPLTGPFVQIGPLGAFNPIRDLQIYVAGALIPVQTWSFDAVNNRYLLFMNQTINLQSVIQVIHHIPSPPFADTSADPLPGFALIASYTPFGDPPPPPPPPVGDFLVQEDGTSEFILESGLGAILLET